MERGRIAAALELTIEELLQRWPRSAEVLRRAGLSGCLGCAMAPFETLAEALRIYRVDAGPVLAELSRIAKGKPCRRTKS